MSYKDLSPLYIQAAEYICREIKNNNFREGEKLPRMNQLSRMLKINTAAMEKALLYLVDENILKKGAFLEYRVEKGAKDKLIEKSKEDFFANELPGLLLRAKSLGISREDIIARLREEVEVDEHCDM